MTVWQELELGLEPLHWAEVDGEWFICVQPECDGEHHYYLNPCER